MPIPNLSRRQDPLGTIDDTWTDAVVRWLAIGTSTSITAIGAASITITGTATSVTSAINTIYNRIRKVEALVTVAATNAVAGWRHSVGVWTVGGASNREGGFVCRMRGGPATGCTTTTSRFFMGMNNNTAAPTDVEPSSLTNIVGLGYDAADTNLQIMHRGTGAITKIDLGANFPVPVLDRTKFYQLQLQALPGTTQIVNYLVIDLVTGSVASGTINTNLPLTTVALAVSIWSSVGGTSSVVGVAMSDIEMSTTY